VKDQTHLGPKTLFSIYTEDKNFDGIVAEVHKEFDGATFTRADGSFKGVQEKACVIQVIGFESNRGAVERVAYDIKKLNDQESVLITAQLLEAVTCI